MQFKRHTSLLISSNVPAARDFYVAQLDLQVNVDLGWFVALGSQDTSDRPFELSLMQVGHPSTPLPESLAGPTEGFLLAFEVADAKAECERFQARGAKLVLPITDHPWGQRNFCVEAPENNTLDIFQSITPDPQWMKDNGFA